MSSAKTRPPLACTLVLLAASGTGFACAEPRPDRIALEPAGPIRLDAPRATRTIEVAGFRGNKAFGKQVSATWSTSDPSVVTVDGLGAITATGSGRATVTATAGDLSATAEVIVTIVGSVEASNELPRPLKLGGPGAQLQVVVKDDKGNVIDKPSVTYKTSDHCAEVDHRGSIKPLADGACDVVVSSGGVSTRIPIEVRE